LVQFINFGEKAAKHIQHLRTNVIPATEQEVAVAVQAS
jgi:hypothetical protein